MSNKPNTLTDDDIDNFLSLMEQKHIEELNDQFSNDSLSIMGFASSSIIHGVQVITELPSKHVVEHFIETTRNRELLAGVQNPYVQLALSLKQDFELGLLPFFNKVLAFEQNNGVILDIETDGDFQRQNGYISKSISEAHNFTPKLEPILDPNISDAFFQRKPVEYENLVASGKRHYSSLAAEVIMDRIRNIDVEEYIGFAEDPRLIRAWETLYSEQLKGESDSELGFSSFFAYLGALFKGRQYNAAKILITVLLEPLISQFQVDDDTYSETDPMDRILEIVPDADKYQLYSCVSEDPDSEPNTFISQLVYKTFVMGTGSGSNAAEAESKAALNALDNELLLDSIRNYKEYLIHENRMEPLEFENLNEGHMVISGDQQINNFNPVQEMQQQPNQLQLQLQQPNQLQLQLQQPNQLQLQLQQQPNQLQLHQQPNQLQLQQQQENETMINSPEIIDFFEPSDDSQIDTSSKEKLNSLLIQNKLTAAQYKTDKVSNSEVQVTCYISSIPLARTISTNKKKAGQYVAQCIVAYFDFFMAMLDEARNKPV